MYKLRVAWPVSVCASTTRMSLSIATTSTTSTSSTLLEGNLDVW